MSQTIQCSQITKKIAPDTSEYKSPKELAHDFLMKFRQETDETRELILRDIQATDTLARMGVTNYRDLFLEHVANERNIPFNRFDPPLPACTCCGCINVSLISDKDNLYYCNECKKKFAPNAGSITTGAKVSLHTYANLLHCLLSYETVARTCELCNISPTTYYRLRNHLYYAISIYLERLTLYGEIQIDETYLNISYKGTSLRKSQFDDEDDLFAVPYKPRDRRSRGGGYSQKESNANKIAILTAVDNRGYVYSSYASIGIPNVRRLRKNIQTNKFLHFVPEKDDFPYPLKPPHTIDNTTGNPSLLIFDGSSVLRKFAEQVVNMEYYARVFRRDGVQKKTPKKYKHLNTQRVNYIHRRLRERIYRSGSGSSRYIKGTLLLFDFMMNTGAPRNKKAIDALLRILVMPDLKKDASFYDNYFSLPNHLLEWAADGDSVLSKLPYPNIYGYSLYDRYKNPDNYPNVPIPTLDEIQNACGLSIPTIRSNYRDYKAAGYHDRIVRHFAKSVHDPLAGEQSGPIETFVVGSDIDAAALEIFDRRAVERSKPYRLRKSLVAICNEVNKQYHSDYKPGSFHHIIRQIIEEGLREEPPEIVSTDKFLHGYPVSETGFFLLEQYDILVEEELAKNKKPPGKTKIYDRLAEDFPEYTRDSILSMVGQARRFLRKQEQEGVTSQKHDHLHTYLDDIYSAYCDYRRTHWIDKQEEDKFWIETLHKYNLNVGITWLQAKMHQISNKARASGGLQLPDYLPHPRKADPPDSAVKVVETYHKIKNEREVRGLEPLDRTAMIKAIKEAGIVSDKYNKSLSESSIATYLSEAKIVFPKVNVHGQGPKISAKERETQEAYEALVAKCIADGTDIPSLLKAAAMLKDKLQLTKRTTYDYLKRARKRIHKESEAQAPANSNPELND